MTSVTTLKLVYMLFWCQSVLPSVLILFYTPVCDLQVIYSPLSGLCKWSLINPPFVFLKFSSGVFSHLPSRICTSRLLGCVRYAASVAVWSCCTTIPNCATPLRFPGIVSSIPPRDLTALSATTRIPKSVVGAPVHNMVHFSCYGLYFDRTLVTWHLSLSKSNTLTSYKIQLHLLSQQKSSWRKLFNEVHFNVCKWQDRWCMTALSLLAVYFCFFVFATFFIETDSLIKTFSFR